LFDLSGPVDIFNISLENSWFIEQGIRREGEGGEGEGEHLSKSGMRKRDQYCKID